jgi:S-adenosylmethionine decarboxylase
MRIRDIDLPNYLFEIKEEDLNNYERKDIIKKIDREMSEIFFGINLPNV